MTGTQALIGDINASPGICHARAACEAVRGADGLEDAHVAVNLDVRFVAGAVATVWCVTISIARPFFIVTDSGEDLGVVTADAIRKAQWRAGVA